MSEKKPTTKTELEIRALIEDLDWLENEFPSINEHWIESNWRRIEIEKKLNVHGLLGLVK